MSILLIIIACVTPLSIGYILFVFHLEAREWKTYTGVLPEGVVLQGDPRAWGPLWIIRWHMLPWGWKSVHVFRIKSGSPVFLGYKPVNGPAVVTKKHVNAKTVHMRVGRVPSTYFALNNESKPVRLIYDQTCLLNDPQVHGQNVY
ncbi:MAG: hypothetical protein WC787_03990 [Patescibacteria group bacterium]|jgi:hypothetical protein